MFVKVLLILLSFQYSMSNVPAIDQQKLTKLYAGIENQLHIRLNGCNPEDVSVKISIGHLFKRNDSLYIISVGEDMSEIKVKLYYKNIIIESISTPILLIPSPIQTLFFQGEKDGFIKAKDLMSMGDLQIKYNDDYPKILQHEILSYHLSFFIKNSNTQNLDLNFISNNKMSQDMLAKVKSLLKGDKIILTNIVGRNPINGQQVNLGSKQIGIIE